ncbi:MAG: biotin transporter BioY [Eubacteriales bacterium]
MKTKDLTLIALFASLITVCSWISVPAAVPFTLQTMAVFLAVGLLGGRRGSLAVAVYIALGAVGAPVFSGFRGGLGVLVGNTGGYIVGFLFAALLLWLLSRFWGEGQGVLALSMLLGLLLCYTVGSAWFLWLSFRAGTALSLPTVLSWCVFPFVLPDLVKIAVALLLIRRLKPHFRRA